jgi:hypothetical protein
LKNSLTIDEKNQSRNEFLKNSFCGKFIGGIWEKTIHQREIDQKNQFLRKQINESEMFNENIRCEELIKINGFYSKQITEVEYQNPMAFTILLYKNLYQFKVLFTILYVRINCHCIHLDLKAPINLFNYVSKLSTCLENVYLSTQRINITWGTIDVLQAETNCQQILIKKSSKWFYHMTIAVNLFSKDFYLQINLSF